MEDLAVDTKRPAEPGDSPAVGHQGALWPFEQWFIGHGALAPGMGESFGVAGRVIDALAKLGFVELLYWDEEGGLRGPGAVPGEGCDVQLWSAVVPEGFHRLETGGDVGRM